MARRSISLTLYFVGALILFLLALSLLVQPMPLLVPVMSLGYWPEAASLCFFLSYLLLSRPFSRPGRFRFNPDCFLFLSLFLLGISSFPRWFGLMRVDELWGISWELFYCRAWAVLWVVCFPLNLVGFTLYYQKLWNRKSAFRSLLLLPGRLLGGLSLLCLGLLALGVIVSACLEEPFGETVWSLFYGFGYLLFGELSRNIWLVFALMALVLHASGMVLICRSLHKRTCLLARAVVRLRTAPPSLSPSPSPSLPPAQQTEGAEPPEREP
ncbi:MAG: hypothetical protein ACI4SG_08960 [Oligosphaeraceae bacterium]